MALRPRPGAAAAPSNSYQSFDMLATLVTVVDSEGFVRYSNAALEDVLGISRRSIMGSALADQFTEPS